MHFPECAGGPGTPAVDDSSASEIARAIAALPHLRHLDVTRACDPQAVLLGKLAVALATCPRPIGLSARGLHGVTPVSQAAHLIRNVPRLVAFELEVATLSEPGAATELLLKTAGVSGLVALYLSGSLAFEKNHLVPALHAIQSNPKLVLLDFETAAPEFSVVQQLLEQKRDSARQRLKSDIGALLQSSMPSAGTVWNDIAAHVANSFEMDSPEDLAVLGTLPKVNKAVAAAHGASAAPLALPPDIEKKLGTSLADVVDAAVRELRYDKVVAALETGFVRHLRLPPCWPPLNDALRMIAALQQRRSIRTLDLSGLQLGVSDRPEAARALMATLQKPALRELTSLKLSAMTPEALRDMTSIANGTIPAPSGGARAGWPGFMKELRRALENMPKLVELGVSELGLDSMESFPETVAGLGALRSLAFRTCIPRTTEQFCAALRNVPSLEALSLQSVVIPLDGSDMDFTFLQKALLAAPNLRKLELSVTIGLPSLLSAVNEVPPGLADLTVSGAHVESAAVQALAGFIKRQPGIKTLSINTGAEVFKASSGSQAMRELFEAVAGSSLQQLELGDGLPIARFEVLPLLAAIKANVHLHTVRLSSDKDIDLSQHWRILDERRARLEARRPDAVED